MDATDDDRDILLQKASADYIADFDRSLGPFLRKPDGKGGLKLRNRVRTRDASRLCNSVSILQLFIIFHQNC